MRDEYLVSAIRVVARQHALNGVDCEEAAERIMSELKEHVIHNRDDALHVSQILRNEIQRQALEEKS